MDTNSQPTDIPPNPPDNSIRQWAVAMHLSPLIGLVVPFGSLIAPLVLWLVKRPESAALDRAGKDALNFQISIAIYAVVSLLLMFVLIGFLTIFVVLILWIYGVVMAAVKAGNGEEFNYPATIKFFK